MPRTWDIFCRVVDNYGDIGITWRLARQLVAEHGQTVRLWVDELAAFVKLCPEADARAAVQFHAGVEVRHWPEHWQPVEPAAVVIEAFACRLPETFEKAMGASAQTPLWLNLEYLSAEDWVAGCHGLPSLQPGGLLKYFFFPGFATQTGGLLREGDLLARRLAFQADAQGQRIFLAGLGVHRRAEERLISLFAYENHGLASWLDALAADARPTRLLIPEGRIQADLQLWLGGERLRAGDSRQQGNLQINLLPFIRQDEYDRLLWCCDFNAVRGEDSFVRAQWAGRPMLWHIYPQADGAHWDKLDAFLNQYCQTLSPEAGQAVRELWRVWNAGADMTPAWQRWLECRDELQAHAQAWSAARGAETDLASRLLDFCARMSPA